MENSTSSAVASLTEKREMTNALLELDGASRVLAIPSFAWDVVVQQVLRVANLSVNELLLSENVAPQPGSSADVLGHRSLRALVEGSKRDNGLEQDWLDFRAKMTALVYRTKFNISESDFKEINAQVEDACEILGRQPIDSTEFHGAKQKVLAERVESLLGEQQRLQHDFDRRFQSLQHDLTRKSSEAEQARSEAQRVAADAAQSIQAMRRETALLQERTETQANARIEDERNANLIETQRKLAEQRVSLEGDIAEALSQKQVAEGELNDLLARIQTGEYVARAEVKAIEDKLEQIRMSELSMRNELLTINQQLTDERLANASLREQVSQAAAARDLDQKHIEELEKRVSTIIHDRTQTTEFVVLNERLSYSREANTTLTAELNESRLLNEKLGRALNDVRGAHKQLRIDGRQYCDALKAQISVLDQKNSLLVRNLTQVKMVLAVAMTTGMGVTAVLVLKHLSFL